MAPASFSLDYSSFPYMTTILRAAAAAVEVLVMRWKVGYNSDLSPINPDPFSS